MKRPQKILRIFFAILFSIQLWLPPHVTFAEVMQIGPGLYMAGIPSNQFQFFAAPESYGRQRSENWCWAACIQMVLNYHGLYVTQEQIVAKVFGELIDHPGSPEQIVAALSGWAPDIRGRYSSIVADPYNINGPSLVTDLAYRWPLIIGLQNRNNPVGHAYVLTAVTYMVDQNNNPIFQTVVLRNPWPGDQSREEISWDEFSSRVMFATRVHVIRQ